MHVFARLRACALPLVLGAVFAGAGAFTRGVGLVSFCNNIAVWAGPGTCTGFVAADMAADFLMDFPLGRQSSRSFSNARAKSLGGEEAKTDPPKCRVVAHYLAKQGAPCTAPAFVWGN